MTTAAETLPMNDMEQVAADTIRTKKDTIDTSEWAAKVTGEEGQLQPRYIPAGDTDFLDSTHYYNRFALAAGAGYLGQYNKKFKTFAIPVTASLTYNFTPIHALRGRLSYAKLHRRHAYDVKSASMELHYLVNLTNYVRGYSPTRLLTFSLYGGLGGRLTAHDNERTKSPFLLLGGQVDLSLGNNVGLSLQPYVGAIRDEYFLHKESSSSFYQFMYGFNANVQFDFQRRRFQTHRLDSSAIYVETSLGATFPRTGQASTGLGNAYALSIGYWPNRILGVKASIIGIDYVWNKQKTEKVLIAMQQVHGTYTTRNYAGIGGGRVEVMLDPFNFSQKWRENRFFDVDFSIGPEYGRFAKSGESLVTRYWAATVAAQVLYKVPKAPNAMIFLEPRYSWMFYKIPYANTDNELRKKERLFLLSAGVRISRDMPVPKYAEEDYYHGDTARNFARLSWGGMRIIQRYTTISGSYKLNNSIQASAGRDFNAWATAALQFDYSLYCTSSIQSYRVNIGSTPKSYQGLWDINYHLITLRAMYGLPINSLLGYHRHERAQRLRLNLLTGPAYTWKVRGGNRLSKGEMAGGDNPTLSSLPKRKHSNFGWALAIQARMSIKSNWGIVLEPMGEYHFGNGSVERLFLYNHIGAIYTF